MPNQIEPFPLQKVCADHRRAYEIMKTYRDINWICTAPPEIVDLPYTGTCKVTSTTPLQNIKLNTFTSILLLNSYEASY